MNPLQYTSEEMFSSTELIRKSKMVFDKLQKDDIEKAIILRDGKPSFMLLGFAQYEEIMSEYMALKEMLGKQPNKKTNTSPKEVVNNPIPKQDENIEDTNLDEDDFETALAQIDELDLETLEEDKKSEEDTSKEALKEFWE
ncbi:hypothetical protein [Arcobacter sp. LA11]|uniref:hypothetical protein n=1 Tax=Arcobacter sp. LA11 TaxID=1898176 RepID=UPI000932BB50|nr:hypothetical protein [Arcobacter sp. LA11]